MKNRILLIVAVLMLALLPLISVAACGDKPADTPVGDEAATESSAGETGESSVETEYDGPLPELPVTVYENEKFHVLTRSSGEWTVKDIYAEEDSADTIVNAIYERNLQIEQDLGVKVEQTLIDVNAIYNTLYNSVAGGETIYDAVDMNLMTSFEAASQGLLYDLEVDIPYIDLSKPWWDQTTREDFSIKNKLYYTASDINLMSYMATWVAVFNKDLMKDLGYGEDYIYNCVREGKWTLDEYYNIVKVFTEDINNDNNMTSVDKYGTSMQGSGPDGFMLCAGLRYCTKNENDELIFKELDDQTLDLLQKVMKVASPTHAYNSHSPQNEIMGTDPENGRRMFTENRALFFTETLQAVDSFRDMEANFGIVPLPKYDEDSEYTSFIHYWGGSAVSVPTSAPDLEKTGVVLEYMAYLSHRYVTPVYFSRVVEGKFSRDEDSLDMIENYIMTNRIFDLVMANRLGGLPDLMMNLINSNTNAFASRYGGNSKNMAIQISKLNDSFE